MSDIKLWISLVSQTLKVSLQYRLSFLLLLIARGGILAVEVFSVWVLFERFKTIEGFTYVEIALFFGVAHLSLGLAHIPGTNFQRMAQLINSGRFDRLLLRPRSTALQVSANGLGINRLGSIVVCVLIVVWSISQLDIVLSLDKIILLSACILGATCTFLALFIIQGTVCFWTIEGLQVFDSVTYGGAEAAQYPLSIYKGWFRNIFTFVIPLASVVYYPLMPILEREDPLQSPLWFQYTSPILGVIFLRVALIFWSVGQKRYLSTGS